jgi:hypothetical protein
MPRLLPLPPAGLESVIGGKVDIHARHPILVRVLAKDPAESADLPKDGCSMHPDPLEALKTALQVPNEPEANQVRDDCRRHAAGERFEHGTSHTPDACRIGIPGSPCDAHSFTGLHWVMAEV